MFYECISLSIEGDNREEMPPFVFDVYDFDDNVLVDTQDFMARCVIPVEESSHIIVSKEAGNDNGKPPEPKWHKCYFKQGGAPCGEILVSFVIADDYDYNFKT